MIAHREVDDPAAIHQCLKALLVVQPLDLPAQHALQSILTIRPLPAKSLWIQAGDVADAVAYVAEGLVRMYFLVDGKEVTRQFFPDGTFAADFASFVTRQPAAMYLETIEPTRLVLLPHDRLQQVYQTFPQVERMGRLMAERMFAGLSARNAELLTHTPEQRYDLLLAQRASLAQRIPLYMIASYLNITPEALSRIRARRR